METQLHNYVSSLIFTNAKNWYLKK